MELEKYQKEYRKWVPPLKNRKEALSYGALGLTGEAGEVADRIKKVFYHFWPEDRAKLVEELGDTFFYFLHILDTEGITLEEVLEANNAKLLKRMPNGWNAQDSIH